MWMTLYITCSIVAWSCNGVVNGRDSLFPSRTITIIASSTSYIRITFSQTIHFSSQCYKSLVWMMDAIIGPCESFFSECDYFKILLKTVACKSSEAISGVCILGVAKFIFFCWPANLKYPVVFEEVWCPTNDMRFSTKHSNLWMIKIYTYKG